MTFAALLIVLLSALLHAGWNTAAKGSAAPAAFLLGMDSFSLVLLAPLLLLCDLGVLRGELLLLVLASGIVHGFYAYFLVRAYEVAELSLVYPIARSTPAFVPVVAVPLFGERLTPLGGTGIALVVVSVWLVLAGGSRQTGAFAWRRLIARQSTFAYLTLATTVVYSLVDKRAMEALSALAWTSFIPRSMLFLILIQVIYLPIFAILAGRRRVGLEVLRHTWRRENWRVAVGAVGGFLSYSLILQAMRGAPVSYVVAVRQTSVVFAVLLGVLWLGERPSPLRLLGVAGTVAGVAVISLAG